MIDDQMQAEWLSGLQTELGIKFRVGPYQPEFLRGDTVGVVTPVLGPGLIREGLWRVVAFQIELVGRDRSQAGLKRSFDQIDTALIFGEYPAELWGTWVTAVDRVGSEPAPNQEDEHQRQSWVCTYFAEISP